MSVHHTRVKVLQNPHYKRSGIKSYVWLLQKYNIAPTKEGPFCCIPRTQLQAKLGHGGLHGIISEDRHSYHHAHQSGPSAALDNPLPSAVGGQTASRQTVLQKVVDRKNGTAKDVVADDQQNDSLYLSPVAIGTPAQTLMLDFDTGSSDLWVWSDKLPAAVKSKGKAAGHKIFDSTKSSTFKASPGSSQNISYGDGSSASGIVGTDIVQLGGIQIQKQAIELSSTLAKSFQEGIGNGLLGLAFGKINTVNPQRVQTPIENMIAQQDIPKTAELFTAYLGSWRDIDEDDKGAVLYTACHSWPGFWEFKSASASVNNQRILRRGNTAIADTGTTLALVADNVCAAIYAAIPGSKYDSTNQGYVFPANTPEANLPLVAFDVGGKEFAVQKEDLGFADAGNGMVYGGIQPRGSLTFDILGDTWLKGIYAIFDQGNNRFGCVERIEKQQNLALPPQ